MNVNEMTEHLPEDVMQKWADNPSAHGVISTEQCIHMKVCQECIKKALIMDFKKLDGCWTKYDTAQVEMMKAAYGITEEDLQ